MQSILYRHEVMLHGTIYVDSKHVSILAEFDQDENSQRVADFGGIYTIEEDENRYINFISSKIYIYPPEYR